MDKKIPRIIIAGRPNVGKSTLFNRLYGSRKALVHDLPGVTRDRLEEKCSWHMGGRIYEFILVDTGGLGGEKFTDEIARQVELAMEDAAIALVVFDAQTGLIPQDIDAIRIIRERHQNPNIQIIGIVNKVDEHMHEDLASDFYATGLDSILTVSAEHGRGIDDLKLLIIDKLKCEGEIPPDEETVVRNQVSTIPKIAVIGKPNVGKSTFVNALQGKQRMITSPISGTTIDAIDSLVELDGSQFLFIDTAGIRRKNKTEQGVEVLSVIMAKKALERADIAILIMDGQSGPVDQDEKIGSIVEDVGCAVVIAVNKWDLQIKNQEFSKEYAAQMIRQKMAYLSYAPIIFVSSIMKTGFNDLASLLNEVLNQRSRRITAHELTEWIISEAEVHNPFGAKFFTCNQVSNTPPTFVCHINDPKKIHFSLERHLVNALRERWGFMGCPIRLKFVQSKSKSRK